MNDADAALAPSRRADARRNESALLEAAAAEFVATGADAPVRRIAARAGVGMGTVYRHFPTRAHLIMAVYRHQIDALVAAAAEMLDAGLAPADVLARWLELFADFLVTKHGLAEVLQSDDPNLGILHGELTDRLVPVCGELLHRAKADGALSADVDGYTLLRGIGNLCIGAAAGTGYDARRMVRLVIGGLLPVADGDGR